MRVKSTAGNLHPMFYLKLEGCKGYFNSYNEKSLNLTSEKEEIIHLLYER
jgi:hypothetical protein